MCNAGVFRRHRASRRACREHRRGRARRAALAKPTACAVARRDATAAEAAWNSSERPFGWCAPPAGAAAVRDARQRAQARDGGRCGARALGAGRARAGTKASVTICRGQSPRQRRNRRRSFLPHARRRRLAGSAGAARAGGARRRLSSGAGAAQPIHTRSGARKRLPSARAAPAVLAGLPWPGKPHGAGSGALWPSCTGINPPVCLALLHGCRRARTGVGAGRPGCAARVCAMRAMPLAPAGACGAVVASCSSRQRPVASRRLPGKRGFAPQADAGAALGEPGAGEVASPGAHDGDQPNPHTRPGWSASTLAIHGGARPGSSPAAARGGSAVGVACCAPGGRPVTPGPRVLTPSFRRARRARRAAEGVGRAHHAHRANVHVHLQKHGRADRVPGTTLPSNHQLLFACAAG